MKREQLIRELRKIARDTGMEAPEIFEDKGKGSHCRVKFNGKLTTIKSGELTPGYVRLIKKQLGID
ncbi:hypothetical protein B5K11_09660 [Rhizobium leguminosarum bv. trifolii]|uniref:hypothetical protein n=1 Tax=Rhizobium leguminosarum TaxID=384 RepID=UPI000E2EF51C|nr:hypothetical protein [Rhizobium leguminosarum]RFB95209.1 hypothetical protein B5K11_09660 [Rhizobium leguminosarum bv. trifolii]